MNFYFWLPHAHAWESSLTHATHIQHMKENEEKEAKVLRSWKLHTGTLSPGLQELPPSAATLWLISPTEPSSQLSGKHQAGKHSLCDDIKTLPLSSHL